MAKIGDRVGAVQSADKETVYLYGYGVYHGKIDSPLGHPNPKILLDSGKAVWGYQCWWGPEENVREMIGDRKVQIAEIEEEI